MVNITTYTSLSNSPLASSPANATSQSSVLSTEDKTDAATSTGSTGTISTVSSEARQLSEAATRAESRDSGLRHTDLGQKASDLLDQITGDRYFASKAQHDAETSDADTPELLIRAKQATDFVNGSASNPFKGISRDKLTLIAYDNSGSFTINERRAAWEEASNQEEGWRKNVVGKAVDEYNSTGKLTNFSTEVLVHYEGLPAIEKARYPEGYASKLQEMIDLDFNNLTHQAEGKGSSLTSLLEQLVAAGAHAHEDTSSTFSSTAVQSTATIQSTSPISTASSATPASGGGRDLMVSRLFGGKEPAVGNGAQGMSTSNIGRSAYEFLTRDDRALLSEMYAYAQEEGADLTYVDNLADELGDYRKHDNGRLSSNFNNGTNYDIEGHQLTVSFSDKDAATASRILSGSAINSTRLDQGFVHYILNPGYGALSNTSSLGFLEQMVTKLSSEGATQSSIGRQFATYAPVTSIKDNIVLSASMNVKLKPFQPDITNVNGVWTITEKGMAAGITLDEVIGTSQRPISALIGQEQNRYILDALVGNGDQSTTRPNWLSSLFKRLQQP